MTSIYEEKIYPQLPETAPIDTDCQTYRLIKIEEAEQFLRNETEKRDKLTKQFKQRATTSTISDTSVITAITALGSASIATLASGVGIPISIVFASTGLFLGLGSAVIHGAQRMFDSKAKKHDKIKTLAESKLDTIPGIISKSVEDSHISHQEYQLILKEVKRYREMEEDIRKKSEKTIDAITAEMREEILKQGREKGRQDFLAKVSLSSATPTVNAT